MGNIIAWLPSIVKLAIELYKLLSKLRASGERVSSCSLAIKKANDNGDIEDLKRILTKIEKSGENSCQL